MTLRTPPTHWTFVQRLTLPKVVLRYYKQWQTESNENSRKFVIPPTKADRMVVPTMIFSFLMCFPIHLCNTLHLVHLQLDKQPHSQDSSSSGPKSWVPSLKVSPQTGSISQSPYSLSLGKALSYSYMFLLKLNSISKEVVIGWIDHKMTQDSQPFQFILFPKQRESKFHYYSHILPFKLESKLKTIDFPTTNQLEGMPHPQDWSNISFQCWHQVYLNQTISFQPHL